MKIIGVGDNVTDCYVHEGNYYPGGCAVNVAVGGKRYGFDEAAYIGVFGDDGNAKHIKWALEQEGVSYARARTMYGYSGKPGVRLDEQGDRIFLRGPRESVQRIVSLQLIEEDLAYIKDFDICHSSVYSSIEHELPKLKTVIDVSYDFSERMDEAYLKLVCPHVKFAFFSCSTLSEEEIQSLFDRCHGLGVSYVCGTLGGNGSILSDGTRTVRQGIVPAQVVDTMGAGDNFIAGFLTAHYQGRPLEEAMAYGAACAAKSCTQRGAFGYPHKIDD